MVMAPHRSGSTRPPPSSTTPAPRPSSAPSPAGRCTCTPQRPSSRTEPWTSCAGWLPFRWLFAASSLPLLDSFCCRSSGTARTSRRAFARCAKERRRLFSRFPLPFCLRLVPLLAVVGWQREGGEAPPFLVLPLPFSRTFYQRLAPSKTDAFACGGGRGPCEPTTSSRASAPAVWTSPNGERVRCSPAGRGGGKLSLAKAVVIGIQGRSVTVAAAS